MLINAEIGRISQRLDILLFNGLNMNIMSDSNAGTYYVEKPCGVASDPISDNMSNAGTFYIHKVPNDYILWGQEVKYTHVQSNSGTSFYFHSCSAVSPEFDLATNAGTNFYYSSAFNCVSFCDAITPPVIP